MTPWTLVYDGFVPEEEGLRESLTALGNGYFCTRGAAEWATDDGTHYPGTYMAGGFNRLTTEVAGRPVVNEDLVNMPNWLPLTFRIEGGEWFNLADVDLTTYRQELDMKDGLMIRVLEFRDKAGRETALTSRRLVNMARAHKAGIEWTLTARNWSGRVEVRSGLDAGVINNNVARYRDLASKHLETLEMGPADDEAIFLLAQTNQSRIQVAQAARTRVFFDGEQVPLEVERTTHEEDERICQDLAFQIDEGRPVRVEKIVRFFTSRDRGIYEPGTEARTRITRGSDFATMLRYHRLEWGQLWHRCDITFAGQDRIQMVVRLHIFHLLQTLSRNTIDLDAGTPARGLHGEAYRGHIFWDELYILPFLNFRLPEVSRSMLLYRYRRLDEARAHAQEAGYKGAMFPWQSGSNGREETQVVHLNPKSGRWHPDLSHNQRHVNAAIAYNIWQYYQATGDERFMAVYGAEMLFEIARFWASIAHYNPKRDRYEIHGVMGPNEYHEKYPGAEEGGVKNNAYTNVMVAWIMEIALEALDGLLDHRRDELRETLEITDEEVSLWADMAHKMYVPYHGDGLISQFEGFDDLEELDWDAYREKYGNIQRMDRILEAEGDSADHYKLSKQADALMLFYLFSEDSLRAIFERLGCPFDEHTAPKNIEYYYKHTSHGSTLSLIVHSAITPGFDPDGSWDMFMAALESDIGDIQGGTTVEGIHLGVMAGTVDLIQRGYMGAEIRDDVLFFNPLLPHKMHGLKFSLFFRGMWLDVELTANKIKIAPQHGGPDTVKVGIGDRIYYLRSGYAREFAL